MGSLNLVAAMLLAARMVAARLLAARLMAVRLLAASKAGCKLFFPRFPLKPAHPNLLKTFSKHFL